MPEQSPEIDNGHQKAETQGEIWKEREKGLGEQDPAWEGFKDYVKKMAQVPKEELDEKLAEEKQEKKEKRAG